jgi:hypothetical protein
MLSKSYRAAHEPTAVDLIHKILAAADGTINTDELTQYVKARDEELSLEFESSQLLPRGGMTHLSIHCGGSPGR